MKITGRSQFESIIRQALERTGLHDTLTVRREPWTSEPETAGTAWHIDLDDSVSGRSLGLAVFEREAADEASMVDRVSRQITELADVCPVCQARAKNISHRPEADRGYVDVACPACGDFSVAFYVYQAWRNGIDLDPEITKDLQHLKVRLCRKGRRAVTFNNEWRQQARNGW